MPLRGLNSDYVILDILTLKIKFRHPFPFDWAQGLSRLSLRPVGPTPRREGTEAYKLDRMDPSTIVPTYGASRINADVFSHRPTPTNTDFSICFA